MHYSWPKCACYKDSIFGVKCKIIFPLYENIAAFCNIRIEQLTIQKVSVWQDTADVQYLCRVCALFLSGNSCLTAGIGKCGFYRLGLGFTLAILKRNVPKVNSQMSNL